MDQLPPLKPAVLQEPLSQDSQPQGRLSGSLNVSPQVGPAKIRQTEDLPDQPLTLRSIVRHVSEDQLCDIPATEDCVLTRNYMMSKAEIKDMGTGLLSREDEKHWFKLVEHGSVEEAQQFLSEKKASYQENKEKAAAQRALSRTFSQLKDEFNPEEQFKELEASVTKALEEKFQALMELRDAGKLRGKDAYYHWIKDDDWKQSSFRRSWKLSPYSVFASKLRQFFTEGKFSPDSLLECDRQLEEEIRLAEARKDRLDTRDLIDLEMNKALLSLRRELYSAIQQIIESSQIEGGVLDSSRLKIIHTRFLEEEQEACRKKVDAFDSELANYVFTFYGNLKFQGEIAEYDEELCCKPLHIAATTAHVGMIRFLLEKGADIHGQNFGGSTPLHVTFNHGKRKRPDLQKQKACAELLMRRGALMSLRNKRHETPLDTALLDFGQLHPDYFLSLCELVESPSVLTSCYMHILPEMGKSYVVPIGQKVYDYLESRTLLDRPDDNGNLPLHIAAMQATPEFIEKVAERTLQTDSGSQLLNHKNSNGETVIHCLVRRGDIPERLFNWLIKEGCNPEARNKIGQTPLHYLAKQGHARLFAWLIYPETSIDVQDDSGNTPLHLAAEKGSSEGVRTLLKLGADGWVVNNEGKSPLQLAIERGAISMVQPLLDNMEETAIGKVSVEKIARDCLKSARLTPGFLQEIRKAGIEDHFFNRLTPLAGKEGNIDPETGNTPLHMAADIGDEKEVEKLLLEDKFDLNGQNRKGYTALHLAARKGFWKVTGLLLKQKGIELETSNFAGATPLYSAANHGKYFDVYLLKKAGATMEIKVGDKSVMDALGRHPEPRDYLFKACLEKGVDNQSFEKFLLPLVYRPNRSSAHYAFDVTTRISTTAIKEMSREELTQLISQLMSGAVHTTVESETYHKLISDLRALREPAQATAGSPAKESDRLSSSSH